MSISSIQKKRKEAEFIKKLVQKGIEPNNFELNKLLTEYFDNHTMGMPYYSPIKQKPYEESNKADYNHNFKTLQEDIETIYEANIEANNRAVAMQEYYDSEKSKVYHALSKLALRTDNIREALKSNSRIKQYVQAFDTLYDVEYYGNAKRNIPYTTAFVDLLQKAVYTDKANANVNKINISYANVIVNGLSDFIHISKKGDIAKVLTDTISDQYIITGQTKSDSKKEIEIILDFGKKIEFNSVFFKFTSTRNMCCQLLLSDDGTNYISVYDITSTEHAEWNFRTKTAQYVKIICIKDEADAYLVSNDNTYYEYYYVLKNISIAREEFESKSVFVSKVIDFDDLTSVIKLDATDMIFNHTRIDYFIGFDNGVDRIGWDAIENHKEHALFMFEKRHKIVNYHYGEFGEHGKTIEAYSIFNLPKNVNHNSIKVTPGYNMWSVYRYNRKNGDSDDGYALHTHDFSEFVNNCTKTQLFMDCENYSTFKIDSNVLYIMTQYVSLEQSMNLYDNFIKIMEDNGKDQYKDAQIKVFVNGYEITSDDNDKYSFALRKGVNKIQIAIYVPSKTATTRKLYHNINFKALTNNVFACVPMKYTSNTILDKTLGDTYQYFTIKNGTVYVKCNPHDMIKSDLQDMGYFITYSCLREDMVDYFEDNHIKFRIMAVLNSSDKNVSPKLIDFRITGR